jgi:hypothetical protein
MLRVAETRVLEWQRATFSTSRSKFSGSQHTTLLKFSSPLDRRADVQARDQREQRGSSENFTSQSSALDGLCFQRFGLWKQMGSAGRGLVPIVTIAAS